MRRRRGVEVGSSTAERAELASRPRPDLRPRGEIERDRRNTSVSSVPGWLFRQWWLYGVGASWAPSLVVETRARLRRPSGRGHAHGSAGSGTGTTGRAELAFCKDRTGAPESSMKPSQLPWRRRYRQRVPNDPAGLLRHEVEEMLTAGLRWWSTYCSGERRPDGVGAGPADLRACFLTHVPNVVDARRLAGGRRITKIGSARRGRPCRNILICR